MATKSGKVVTYGERLLPVNSNNPLKMWLRDKLKALYFYYHNVFDHKTFQGGEIPQRDANLKFA